MYTDTVYLVAEPVFRKRWGTDVVTGIKVTKMLRHRPDAKPGQTIIETEVKIPKGFFSDGFEMEVGLG